MNQYRKPFSVVSIIAGLALVVAGFVAAPAGAVESSGSITYSCEVLLFGTVSVGTSASPVTVTFNAPDSVTPGQSFDVTVDVDPGLVNGPVAITAANAAKATMDLTVGGATPATAGATSTTNVTGPANGTLPLPTLRATVTAGASGNVTVTAAQLRVRLSSGTLIRCNASTGSASLQIPISSPTTLDPDAPTTTLDPDATTTTTAKPAPTTAAPTTAAPTTAAPTTAAPPTAAPTTAAPAGNAPAQSQVITKSALISYSCQAYLSGTATGPPTVDTQTVSIRGVDRVNPGQSFPVTVSVTPGVTNGPVPQGAGEIVPALEVSVAGGSPSPLRMTSTANSGDVPAGGTIPVAPMNASVRATASVGGTVDLKPGVMTMAIERFNASVVCTPASRPTVLSVGVVSTPLVVAGSSSSPGGSSSFSNATGSSTLATTGPVNAGALSFFGLAMVLGGVAVLRIGRARGQEA
jgi:hypothetical protein